MDFMLIKSNNITSLNKLNDIPYFGSYLIAGITMLPMFAIHELIQSIFGRNEIFDLSFTFFLNNLFFHIFLFIVLDIRVKILFIPSILFCLFCTILNGIRQYDSIISILNSQCQQ